LKKRVKKEKAGGKKKPQVKLKRNKKREGGGQRVAWRLQTPVLNSHANQLGWGIWAEKRGLGRLVPRNEGAMGM